MLWLSLIETISQVEVLRAPYTLYHETQLIIVSYTHKYMKLVPKLSSKVLTLRSRHHELGLEDRSVRDDAYRGTLGNRSHHGCDLTSSLPKKISIRFVLKSRRKSGQLTFHVPASSICAKLRALSPSSPSPWLTASSSSSRKQTVKARHSTITSSAGSNVGTTSV